MLSLSRLPTIIILATSISSVNGITWRFSSDASCDNPFQNNNIKVTCQGSTHCGLGDTAVVSGTLMARTSFSDSKVTIQACALGYYCQLPFANSLNINYYLLIIVHSASSEV